MAFQRFESILDECLLAHRNGASIDDCLARYPKQAARLRPLLQLSVKVQQTPAVTPRAESQAIAWTRVRQRAAELRRGRQRRLRPGWNYGAWLRPIAVAAVLVAAFMLAGGATVAAAQNALPNSPLYRVKLATEDARLLLTFDDTHKAEILLDQSDERVEEIDSLRRQGDFIPNNVLSTLRNRNERAADILRNSREPAALQARLNTQLEDQEQFLVNIPEADLSQSARAEYASAVASVHNTRLERTGATFVSVQPDDLAGGIQKITGAAVQVEGDQWDIGGFRVTIDDRAFGRSQLTPGATARFVLGVDSKGELRALSLSTIDTSRPSSNAVVKGVIEEVTDQGVRIAGQFIQVSPGERRRLKKGDKVEIALGSSSAKQDDAVVDLGGETLTFEGTIDLAKDGDWKIGGRAFSVPDNVTYFLQAGKAPQEGTRVLVEASVDSTGRLVAESVTVLSSDASSDSVYLVGTFHGSERGVWDVGGIQIVPPSGPAPSPAPDSVVAIEAREDRQNLLATKLTVVEKPGDTDVVHLSGAILAVSGSNWTLDFGHDAGKVKATSTTEVSGKPIVGARVLVWGRQGSDGTLEAFYARVFDQTPVVATPVATPTLPHVP